MLSQSSSVIGGNSAWDMKNRPDATSDTNTIGSLTEPVIVGLTGFLVERRFAFIALCVLLV